MRSILLMITFICAVNSYCQNIVGDTSLETLKSESYNSWFTSGYENYEPDQAILEKLEKLFKKNNFKVEVYFGSWCSDSQRDLPNLVKLLDQAKFDRKNLSLVGVDRDKIVPDVSEEKRQKLNITNVPTIIVYQDGKELNRFVEYAQESIAEDMFKIFSKAPYKHSYQF